MGSSSLQNYVTSMPTNDLEGMPEKKPLLQIKSLNSKQHTVSVWSLLNWSLFGVR